MKKKETNAFFSINAVKSASDSCGKCSQAMPIALISIQLYDVHNLSV